MKAVPFVAFAIAVVGFLAGCATPVQNVQSVTALKLNCTPAQIVVSNHVIVKGTDTQRWQATCNSERHTCTATSNLASGLSFRDVKCVKNTVTAAVVKPASQTSVSAPTASVAAVTAAPATIAPIAPIAQAAPTRAPEAPLAATPTFIPAAIISAPIAELAISPTSAAPIASETKVETKDHKAHIAPVFDKPVMPRSFESAKPPVLPPSFATDYNPDPEAPPRPVPYVAPREVTAKPAVIKAPVKQPVADVPAVVTPPPTPAPAPAKSVAAPVTTPPAISATTPAPKAKPAPIESVLDL